MITREGCIACCGLTEKAVLAAVGLERVPETLACASLSAVPAEGPSHETPMAWVKGEIGRAVWIAARGRRSDDWRAQWQSKSFP